MKTKHLLATGLLALAAALTPVRAATTILHSFAGGASDGDRPYGSLTLSGSKLYGMTVLGGSVNRGALFSMNTDGTGFGLLHSFAGGTSDGNNPYGSLTLSGSKLYGMTAGGGSSDRGTLFSMNTNGTGYVLLHSLAGGPSDGFLPLGSLTLSGAKLYGMTREGGSSFGGALFSMNTDGTGFGLLHSFAGGVSDGGSPYGSLTLSGSKLYGMTVIGGSNSNTGTLFGLNTDGTGYSLLHTFAGGASDGSQPYGSLTLSGSKLYGMTAVGGSNDGGALFSMNTDGTGFGLLHSFAGGASDGASPQGSLTLIGAKLYGMTGAGGSSKGVLFSINTDGTGFGLLASLGVAPSDGASPQYGDLTLSSDASTLYGMTQSGGTASRGVVFSHPTPEPASAALLGLGTLLLAARRRQSAQG